MVESSRRQHPHYNMKYWALISTLVFVITVQAQIGDSCYVKGTLETLR